MAASHKADKSREEQRDARRQERAERRARRNEVDEQLYEQLSTVLVQTSVGDRSPGCPEIDVSLDAAGASPAARPLAVTWRRGTEPARRLALMRVLFVEGGDEPESSTHDRAG